MNVKKFVAPTSREALRKVRDALGSEAIILSNRSIDQGVEILAMASHDMASLANPVVETEASAGHTQHNLNTYAATLGAPASPPVSLPVSIPATPTVTAPLMQAAPAPATAPALQVGALPGNEQPFHLIRRRPEINQATGLAQALQSAQTTRVSETAGGQDMMAMMNEIKNMRSMLEIQLAELSWSNMQKREPVRIEILQELLMAGFSAGMARYLIDKLPAGHSKSQGMNWVRTILTRNLVTTDADYELVDQGGIFALVGPTGVGKTTTTAKLAARVVMRHGPGKLALITTDGYRIGGHEQLRIYGKILGVMVHSVKDEADLRIAINELKGKHTILIDTAGVGQRDQMVAEQIAMLSGLDVPVKRLLCLPATSNGETLNEVVHAYQGNGLEGCIITKLDEAVTLGNVLDTIVRQKLNLYYIANGQRVPEDLHVSNRDYLIDKAFKLKRETASFALNEDELPSIMAHTQYGQSDNAFQGNYVE